VPALLCSAEITVARTGRDPGDALPVPWSQELGAGISPICRRPCNCGAEEKSSGPARPVPPPSADSPSIAGPEPDQIQIPHLPALRPMMHPITAGGSRSPPTRFGGWCRAGGPVGNTRIFNKIYAEKLFSTADGRPAPIFGPLSCRRDSAHLGNAALAGPAPNRHFLSNSLQAATTKTITPSDNSHGSGPALHCWWRSGLLFMKSFLDTTIP